jgi:hypothetical protein
VLVRGGSERTVVTSNQFRDVDTGVWFPSGASDNVAALNTYTGSGSAVTDQGSNNTVSLNVSQ